MLYYLTRFLLLGSILTACSNTPQNSLLKGSGTIEVTEVRVSPLIAGRISRMLLQEGAAVRKGQLLAVLSADELSARLRQVDSSINASIQNTGQAYATLLDAQLKLKRTEKLYKSGIASKQQLDNARTGYKVARLRWKSTRARENQVRNSRRVLGTRLQEARIFSPLSGTVLTRNFEAGETIFPGRVLYALADLHTVYLKIYIPEKKLGRVFLGQQAIVRVDSFPRKDFPGSVAHIASRAEFTPKNVQTEDSRTRLVFAVKISIPNIRLLLKPGMPADGFLLEKKDVH